MCMRRGRYSRDTRDRLAMYAAESDWMDGWMDYLSPDRTGPDRGASVSQFVADRGKDHSVACGGGAAARVVYRYIHTWYLRVHDIYIYIHTHTPHCLSACLPAWVSGCVSE